MQEGPVSQGSGGASVTKVRAMTADALGISPDWSQQLQRLISHNGCETNKQHSWNRIPLLSKL